MSSSLRMLLLRLAEGERNLANTYCKVGLFIALCFVVIMALGQNNTLSANKLQKLSLEKLTNLEVTSVSKIPQNFIEMVSTETLGNERLLCLSLDIRLSYIYKMAKICIVGQDLLAKKHIGFSVVELSRSMYGKISIRL